MKSISKTIVATSAPATWADIAGFGDVANGEWENEGELAIYNTGTTNALQIRFGTAGDTITLPANSGGTAKFAYSIPPGRQETLNADNRLQLQQSGGATTYMIVAFKTKKP